jgi:uncharacterized protein (TIGR02646 family)
MYCGDDAGTAIDHFWPRSTYPERTFVWDNYLWACSVCNSNLKRDCFELDDAGQPLLINPVDDHPARFMRYIAMDGQFEPLEDEAGAVNARGQHTIELLDLNEEHGKRAAEAKLCVGRKDTWRMLISTLNDYAVCRRAERVVEMDELRRAITERAPFPFLLYWLLRAARAPSASFLFKTAQERALLQTLREFPDIYEWAPSV